MEEPEIKLESAPVKKEPKKFSWIKILLIVVGLLVVLIGGGVFYIHRVYNADALKTICEKEVSEALGGECTIGSLDWSLLGSAELENVSITLNSNAVNKSQIIKINRLQIDIDILKSLISFQPVAALLIDGGNINIERVLTAKSNKQIPVTKAGAAADLNLNSAKAVSFEPFSTNVKKVIASFVELPWKEWVAGFDWKIADADLRINDLAVNVHDNSKQLKDMNFTVNFAAHLQKSGVNMELNINEKTPNVSDGGVILKGNVVFDWEAAERRKDKPLAFIGATDFNFQLNKLDIGYIGKYYIQSPEQSLRLGKPLSGVVSIKAESPAAVNFVVDLSSPEILDLYNNGKVISGGGAGLSFKLKAQADISGEWSNIKDGAIDIVCSNSETKAPMVTLNTQLFGSFSDEIVVSIQSNTDTGEMTRSAIGRFAEMQNLMRGDLIFGSEFTWKRDADWKYAVNLRSQNFVVRNDSVSVPAPLTLLVDGNIKPESAFIPQQLTLRAKFTAPGVAVNTLGSDGLSVPLDNNSFALQGKAQANINMPEVFKAFAAPLNKLGLKSIDEVLAAQLQVDDNNAVNVIASLTNTRKQYEPCEIRLVYTPQADNKFDGKFDLTAEKKAVQIKANVSGVTDSGGKTDLTFTKQFALRVGAGMNLLRRIENLIPGLKVAQYPVSGVMRGSSKGRAVIAGDKISLAASNAILIENMTFTTDSGRKFVDKKSSINCSFSMTDLLGERVLNLNALNVTGDTANVEVKVDRLGLKELSSDPLVGLNHMKGLKATVKLGEKTFSNLYAVLGDSVPPALKTGKSLQLEINSCDDGSIDLKKLNVNSTGLVAAVTDLAVNPGKIIAALQADDIKSLTGGLSPFKISVKANSNFWRGMKIGAGLNFSGNAELAAAFDPVKDRLTMSRLILAGDTGNQSFLSRMSAAVIVDNISKIIATPTLPLILESLPQGVNIPVVTVSVPRLTEYIRSTGGSVNLKGRELELSKVRLVKSKEKNTLQLVGNISSSGLEIDKMLSYNGNTTFNNLIKIDGSDFALTGEFNFNAAQLYFKAAPYVYRKNQNEKTRLYYKLSGNQAGRVSVARAGITGGPLQFDMQNLSFVKLAADKFKLSLPVFKVMSPVSLTVKNVVMDPDKNIVTANINTPGIDLKSLNSSLDTGLPSTLSGKIGAINVAFADKYSTVFSGKNQRLASGSKLSVEPSSVTLTSTKQPSVSMTVDVGRISGGTGDGKITVGSMAITSPTDFSDATPLKVGSIESILDLNELAQGRKVIAESIVSSFNAIYEIKLKENNISALQRNMDILLPAPTAEQQNSEVTSQQTATVTNTAGSSKSTGSNNSVVIKDLYLNNGVVAIKSRLINTSVKIPQTHVENIGGSNPRVAFTTILNVLFRSIGGAAVSILDNTAGTAVKSVTNILGNALTNNDKSGNESNSNESTGDSVKNLLNNVFDSDNSNSTGDNSSKSSNPLGGLFK